MIDSNVNVVVLEDIGKTALEGHMGGWQVKFMRYRRLLIRNDKGFDAAKITLSFDEYENGTGREVCSISNILIIRFLLAREG